MCEFSGRYFFLWIDRKRQATEFMFLEFPLKREGHEGWALKTTVLEDLTFNDQRVR